MGAGLVPLSPASYTDFLYHWCGNCPPFSRFLHPFSLPLVWELSPFLPLPTPILSTMGVGLVYLSPASYTHSYYHWCGNCPPFSRFLHAFLVPWVQDLSPFLPLPTPILSTMGVGVSLLSPASYTHSHYHWCRNCPPFSRFLHPFLVPWVQDLSPFLPLPTPILTTIGVGIVRGWPPFFLLATPFSQLN